MCDCIKKSLVFVVDQVFELGKYFFPSKGAVNGDAKKLE